MCFQYGHGHMFEVAHQHTVPGGCCVWEDGSAECWRSVASFTEKEERSVMRGKPERYHVWGVAEQFECYECCRGDTASESDPPTRVIIACGV